MTRWLLALLILIGPAGSAWAQSPEPSAALRSRADQVVAMLKGEADPATMFTPEVLAQVPAAQFRTIAQQVVTQYGRPQRLEGIEAASPFSGVMNVATERATLHIRIAVAPQAPNLISGLLFAGADMRGDTLAAVIGEVRALPGSASIAIARLGEGPPEILASLEPARPMAIGSAFKLFILAELSRQIRDGRRHWDDVVTLDRRSIPSGITQAWPPGSPVTLHTLAVLMISISDNTAADMLLHIVGRENVERMMAAMGVADDPRNRPFLSTMEIFALKSASDADFLTWRNAGEAQRRAILQSHYAAPTPASLAPSLFEGGPVRIDSLEWFVSPADMVRVMDWFRRESDETTRAILAVNSGLAAPIPAGFAYLGYKGGSEPGVLSLNWLIRGRGGAWYAVTGSWNNPAAALEENRFIALMGRAVQLLREP